MTDGLHNQHLDLDTGLLAEFVYALNIARRQIIAYPAGHPAVTAATARLVDLIPGLFEFRNQITLGIAKDSLIFEEQTLDAANPVFRDLARNLFNARVASLTVSRDLTAQELTGFFELFRLTPEQLAERGGLEPALDQLGFTGIRAQGIDFSVFSAMDVDAVHAPKAKLPESEAPLLWKAFAKGMVQGTIDPDGVRYAPREALDPVLLAGILNHEAGTAGEFLGKSYEEAITAFLKQADQAKMSGQPFRETLDRLAVLVEKLNPAMRRKFLNSLLRTAAERPAAAEALLQKIPRADLLDAFEQLDAAAIEIPKTLMDVLGQLARHSADGVSHNRVAGEAGHPAPELAEQLATLFAEDRSEYFVPRDYRDALTLLASVKVDHNLEQQQVDELVASMGSHLVEGQFSAVLLDLLKCGVDRSTGDAVGQNLGELIDYFLEMGDFDSLLRIYAYLQDHVQGHAGEPLPAAREAQSRFADRSFTGAVLDALETWGKAAQASIQALMEQVGEPFAGPLLERLAVEPSMSKRRFLMACLIRMGTSTQPAIAAQLNDSRWYFVRNLVVVLREINDPSSVPLLGRLSGHGHPKVQFEVMKTYLHYGDDRANRFLLRELAGTRPVGLLSAIQLAANSRDPRVVGMLAQLLNRRLPAEHELEIKAGVIKALQESATEEVLPELARFLLGKKLFGGNRAAPLKINAVALLEKIGTVDAGLLAGEVAQATTGDLASAAEAVLTRIHRALT